MPTSKHEWETFGALYKFTKTVLDYHEEAEKKVFSPAYKRSDELEKRINEHIKMDLQRQVKQEEAEKARLAEIADLKKNVEQLSADNQRLAEENEVAKSNAQAAEEHSSKLGDMISKNSELLKQVEYLEKNAGLFDKEKEHFAKQVEEKIKLSENSQINWKN